MIVAAAVLAALVVATTRSGDPETRFETGTDFWSYAPRMPHRRSYIAAAELGGALYVAGGMVGETGKPLDLFERFDPQRNRWTSLTRLPEGFSAAAGVGFQGRVWVLGGTDPGSERGARRRQRKADGRQVYSYDVRRRTWRAEASLPAPRTNLAVVAFGGKLYAIGGLDPFNASRTVFVYDPSTRRWSEGTPLPNPLQAHAAVVFRGEIWVLGGERSVGNVVKDVWIYDARRNRWRAGPPLPEPMETLGADATDNQIHAVLHSTYVVYDAGTRRWRRGPSPNISRHGQKALAIGRVLYSLGGCLYPQLEDSSYVEKIALEAPSTARA